MKLDSSKIKLSRFDIKRGLKFPSKLNEKLAEDMGIMVGDGHINYYRYGKSTDFMICVSNNAITDKNYALNYVKKLKLELYGLNFPAYYKGKNKTEIQLKINSKGLVEFYTKVINLPLGRKDTIGIPSLIMNSNNKIKCAFIRGLADTDFTFTFRKKHKPVMYYPFIKIDTSSKNLIIGIKKILDSLDFKTTVSYDLKRIHPLTKNTFITQELSLNGKRNLKKWMEIIGTSNPKNILKYNLWKKQGFCPRDEEIRKMMKDMGSRGFEPPTSRLRGECSNCPQINLC